MASDAHRPPPASVDGGTSAPNLGVVFGAMALALPMMLSGPKNIANFIGQWVPTILVMGLYSKTVQQQGSG